MTSAWEHRRNTIAIHAAAEACLNRDIPPLPNPPKGFRRYDSENLQALGSIDPNEKYTTGTGDQGFIDTNSTIFYQITFENVSTATAPAQMVTVTDLLDPKLDWSTLQLAGIGFNGVDVVVPAGLQAFAEEGLTVETDPYPVNVRGSLDPDTGVVSWVIESVDPVTGGLPDDPLAGFLPPNDAEHRGEGYVSFMIRPRSELSPGEAVRNRAAIVFDVNDPIETGVVVNTIDSDPPQSRVGDLPATAGEAFVVTWSGDDAGGAGVATYDVYVSADGGKFDLWRFGTDETSGTFAGAAGHTYGFYSVARDRVGHAERPPAGAEAAVRATGAVHSGDYQGNDGKISLSELLRVIQLYNTGEYSCYAAGEDGFAPGAGPQSCGAHSSDYSPRDWRVNLSELLRLIQLYNTGGYRPAPGTEDGFAPGL